MYSDWRDVPIPGRLARRPRDKRGYPIPAMVLIKADGTPDFRVTDVEKWVKACNERTCALCGEQLGRHLAFVGGPRVHENRLFTDLPMHLECAEYALRVCPYIAVPNFKYANALPDVGEGVSLRVAAEVEVARPDRFMLGITRSYQVVMLPGGGSYAVRAAPWEQVAWWQDGKCLEVLSPAGAR